MKTNTRDAIAQGNNPYYVQIYNYIKHMIDSAEWRPGLRLPKLEDLAELFGVSRLTARQAVNLLVQEGYLKSTRGRGAFVQERQKNPHLIIHATADWFSLTQRLKGATAKILWEERGITCLPEELPAECLVPQYQHILRVHSHRGERFALADLYLDQTIFDFAPELFHRQSILATLGQMSEVKVKNVKQVITCSQAGMRGAEYLGLALNDPVADIRRYVTSESDKLIYFGISTYRSNYLKLEVNMRN